jgi:hypothetical protein
MENQNDSNAPPKIYAGKLCIAASISILLGIGLFFPCFLLNRFMKPPYYILKDVCGLGIFLSMALLFFIAPLLGIIAIKDILSKLRSITNPDYISINETAVRKIACNFRSAGLFSALAPFLLIILGISFKENVYVRDLPVLVKIWFIAMVLMALAMGCISYKIFTKTSARFRQRAGSVLAIAVSLIVVAAVFLSTSLAYYFIQRIEYAQRTETFSGQSSSLNHTAIVPTLDSPCPKNKNVIWCSSFQLAWNEIKEDVIKAPIEVVGAEDLAARLNSAEQTADDLEPESFYAAAGRTNQGIIGTIQKDMKAKFPTHTLPDFSQLPKGILAYSYLIANVPFKYPYRQVKGDFIFTDSNGLETNVGAFGVWGYGSQYRRIREQAQILYIREDVNEVNRNLRFKEFAVDLCKHSEPYQVVAAIVEPKDTLAQTLSYVQNQINDFKQINYYERMCFLDDVDVLKVPEMFWQIDHRFEELINKIVTNADPPMPILEAKQSIKFKLDRYGAMLESESNIVFAAIPRKFIFNRPFLVYMKKRDCDRPFFVMWIDNAELLRVPNKTNRSTEN